MKEIKSNYPQDLNVNYNMCIASILTFPFLVGGNHYYIIAISFAQAILPMEKYPHGLPVDGSDWDSLLENLCYTGSAVFNWDYESAPSKTLLQILRNNKRVVLVTGLPPISAKRITEFNNIRELRVGGSGYWSYDTESIKEFSVRVNEDVEYIEHLYGDHVIVNCSKMREFTGEDLQEMLFGTKSLVLAAARPSLKIAMVTACIANDVVPMVTSHLGKCFVIAQYFV